MRPTGAIRRPGVPRRFTIGSPVAAVAVLAVAGCGGESGAEAGGSVVQDSAGVAIVTSSGSGSWGSAGGWLLRETLRIDPDESDADRLFEQIVGIDASRDGRIAIVDGAAHRVHTVDREGKPIASFGRAGSGPGEFPNMTLLQSSRRVVVDSLGRIKVPGADGRLSVFSWVGELVDFESRDGGIGTVVGWTRTDSDTVYQEVLAMTLGAEGTPPAFSNSVFRRESDGTLRRVVDLPARRPPDTSTAGVPLMEAFGPIPVWAVHSDGYVAVALPHEYSIRVYDSDGCLVRIIRRDVQGEVVTDRDREAFLDSHRGLLEEGGIPGSVIEQMERGIAFPDRWPVLGQMLGGPEETLWVQRIDRNRAVESASWTEAFMGGLPGFEWDVFDRDGQYLGGIRLPDGFRPFRFRGEDLYGVSEDDLGVQSVVRLTLER